ncbi:6839_t:CDS:10 [Acaulospora morrowiae]|uniref:ATP-dependent RNA helicase n=1 Tax=Acaulospora morrowiae TaxID=94023 RepID=A0A9N9AAG9_9GLOM|nr:6839_t:CDS:10 [Acaulospora morrowiae]
MFQIQRYDSESDSTPDTSNTGNELLTKINERVLLKRKRSSKIHEEKTTAYVEVPQEADEIQNTVNENSDEHISPRESDLNAQGVDNDDQDLQYPTEDFEEHDLLLALPEIEQPEQTPQEAAAVKLLGIPDWLAHPIIIEPDVTQSIDHPSLGLSERLVKRCKALGIYECFAVQTAVIPLLVRSRSLSDVHQSPGDICVSAPTGSGKTLAYVLPIIEVLSKRIVTRLRALIILPTRDLVIQVKETFEAFCKGTSLKVGAVTGQRAFVHDQEQIVGDFQDHRLGGKSKVDILIATPGRLIEHITLTPNFTLQHLRFLIIDEADRLLNQSYQDWLMHVLRATQAGITSQNKKDIFGIELDSFEIPKNDPVSYLLMENFMPVPKTEISETKVPTVLDFEFIQKLLFSATLTRNPEKIASLRLINPQYISVQASDFSEVEIKYTLPSSLREFMIVTSPTEKPLVVLYLLHNFNISSALCFTKSVDSAHRLAKLIQLFENMYAQTKESISTHDVNMDEAINQKEENSVITVAEYSSDLSQERRKNILKKFKRGEVRLLICSDLIARGMDLDRVDTVINYDVPVYMKKYVHRVGRTARAGRRGDAYSLVETQEANYFRGMLSKAGHMDKVKNIKINSTKLDPLKEVYGKSMSAFKDYMTNPKPSVARYQENVSNSMRIANEIQEIVLDDEAMVE